MITAKVRCNLKQTYGDGENTFATIGFGPDYADGHNREWANATPHLDLRMTVRGEVAEQFQPGQAYTLTFEPE